MKNKNFFAIGVAATFVVAATFLLVVPSTTSYESLRALEGEPISLYTSFSCGCCDIHGDYVVRNSRANLLVHKLEVDVLEKQKDLLGVPASLRTCHTTVIGEYFVEGHIPAEAIDKLLREQPDIKGIAMPGMPSGSPGMPGSKTDDFVIYAVGLDDSIYEFMRV